MSRPLKIIVWSLGGLAGLAFAFAVWAMLQPAAPPWCETRPVDAMVEVAHEFEATFDQLQVVMESGSDPESMSLDLSGEIGSRIVAGIAILNNNPPPVPDLDDAYFALVAAHETAGTGVGDMSLGLATNDRALAESGADQILAAESDWEEFKVEFEEACG